MNLLTASEISALSTSELLKYFNEHSGLDPVKKFADRKTAERRVLNLVGLGGATETAAASPASTSQYDTAPEHKIPKRKAKALANWRNRSSMPPACCARSMPPSPPPMPSPAKPRSWARRR